jgi:tRNA-dihydrouridine synthase
MNIIDIVGEEDIKYQIFISSTYKDLKEERSKLIQAILGFDQIPVGMELFKAADEETWKVIKKTIDSSDCYMLVIGDRYGSMKDGVSYTEMEYDYAYKRKIHVLPFIKNNRVNDPEETEEHKFKLKKFIDKVQRYHAPAYWDNINDLVTKVQQALHKEIKKGSGTGWIRTSTLEKILRDRVKVSFIAPGIEDIRAAEECIFLSGTGMSFLDFAFHRKLLAETKAGITITLAPSKHDDEDIATYLKSYFGKSKIYLKERKEHFDKALEVIKETRTVNDIYLDVFNPIAYFAVDYRNETKASCIWAKHYLLNIRSQSEYFYIKITPNDVSKDIAEKASLYHHYRKQILLIEDSDGKLKNRPLKNFYAGDIPI